MFQYLLLALLVTLICTFYVSIVGTKEIRDLKEKVSIKKYFKQMSDALDEFVGDGVAIAIKLLLVVFAIIFVVVNAILFLYILVGIVLGIFLSKKLQDIPSVKAFCNKMTIYVNRLFKR